MKTTKTLLVLAALGVGVLTAAAQMGGGGGMGGTNSMGGGTMTNHTGGGMWWTNVCHMTNMSAGGWTNMHQVVPPNHQHHGTMPQRPGGHHVNMPADMQTLMQQFQADRQAFMAQQRRMETQMQGATEQQRQTMMAQMQQQLQQMREQHAQMRRMMHDQMQQMMQRMQDQQRLMQNSGQSGGMHGGRPR